MKPDTLRAVITENLECLEQAGFKNVVLVNAHGDPVHRKVITEALQAYNNDHQMQAKWLTFQCDMEMEGFRGDENCLIILPDGLLQYLGSMDGQLEIGLMYMLGHLKLPACMRYILNWTNLEQAKQEQATLLKGEQISKWLGGDKKDKDIIPMGYVGSPKAFKQIHSTQEKYSRELQKRL